jgi:hypothetical protein
MEGAAVLGLARLDRAPQVRRRPTREGRPGRPDLVEPVGVAVAESGQAMTIGEGDDAAVPRSPERRRVEGLQAIRPEPFVGLIEQAPEHETLGAQRVRHERMGWNGEAALLVDRGDRRAERPERPDRTLQKQAEQVTAERRDLLPDDDLERQAPIGRDRAGGQGGVDMSR